MKKGGTLPNSVLESSITPIAKSGKDYKKIKLQANTPDECRCKNPE